VSSGQEIIIIAAVSENGVIGKDNKMPWNIKGNLAHFKKMTMGYPCIMGRKTYDSLPIKHLPGRLNIIISNSSSANSAEPPVLSLKDILFFQSISEAIEFCKDYEKIFICGGESIYKQSMQLADKIDLTLIPGQYEGDTFFPEIDDSWIKTNTVNHDNFSVITYIKKERI